MSDGRNARVFAAVAMLAPFLATPIGMGVYALIHYSIGGMAQYFVAFGWGLLGFALVAAGLKRDELRASIMGFVGGWMMWGGWFEFTFQGFASLLRIPDLVIAPGLALPGSNGLQLASTPFLLAMLLLYGLLNRQTRCNFMRFMMRQSHLSPGMPLQGVARSFSRTTAMETIFIIWALNSFWLSVFWATAMGTAFFVVLGFYAIWVIYLIARQLRNTRPAPTIRYGVAVGIFAWILVELPAQSGLFTEAWRRPLEHPIVALAMLATFVAALGWIARAGGSRRVDDATAPAA